MSPPLRIGLIVADASAEYFLFDLLAWARQRSDITFSHLYVERPAAGAPRAPAPRCAADREMSGSALWPLVRNIEQLGSVQLRGMRDWLGCRDLRPQVPHVAEIATVAGPGAPLVAEPDVQAMQREGFDLLVHAGSTELRGPILEAARLGILSIRHGDDRLFRGGPPAFWEVLERCAQTGFSIRVTNAAAPAGLTLARGGFPTRGGVLGNRAMIQRRSNVHLKRVLAAIAQSGGLPAADESVPYCGPLRTVPTAARLLRYLAQNTLQRLRLRAERLAGREEDWSVSYAPGNWRQAVFAAGTDVPNPPGRYFADPFLLEHAGRAYLFVEDYSHRAGKAVISVLELQPDGARFVGVALSEPHHLSFPFLFRHEGELYLCPEGGGSGEIRLYRCTGFPLQWEHARTLMRGVSAADTMLFERDGRWWMLTSLDVAQVGDRSSELFLFHADSPLSDAWVSHPLNPIVIDSTCGRNAGLLREGERVFRVAQRNGGPNQYGRSAAVYEITRLDASGYSERLVCELRPDFSRAVAGTHHLHAAAGQVVWDYKTWRWRRGR